MFSPLRHYDFSETTLEKCGPGEAVLIANWISSSSSSSCSSSKNRIGKSRCPTDRGRARGRYPRRV